MSRNIKTFDEWINELDDFDKDYYIENIDVGKLNYENYLLYEKYPVMSRFAEDRVFYSSISASTEDDKIYYFLTEGCDSYFSSKLNSKELRELSSYFAQIADCMDKMIKEN